MENWIWLICPSRSIRVIFLFFKFSTIVSLSACARDFFTGSPSCRLASISPLLLWWQGEMGCLALPACWQFTSSPRPCPRFSLFYFILFFSGWTRTPWTGGGSGWRDRRTDRRFFLFFLFPTTKKSNNFFSFCFYDDCWDNILCRTHKSGRDSISLLWYRQTPSRWAQNNGTASPVPNGQRARSIISRGRKTFSFFFFIFLHFSFVST